MIGILLNDSAGLEASRIRRENRRREEKNKPLLEALYTQADVDDAMAFAHGHKYDVLAEVLPGLSVRFHDAGHIMGSAVVELALDENGQQRTLVFSGDLGQYDSPILKDPVSPVRADRVVMESTYGDRRHRDRKASLEEMGEVFRQAWEEGGNVLIPAFAVGRSQEILYHLGKHFEAWGIDRWHIFLDSPLGIEASEIYWDYDHLFDAEANRIFREDVVMPKLPNLHFTRSSEESQVINRMRDGAIVIAGSGMCNGGRILHHFRHNIDRRETHVLFTGFQPPGTLGRRIIDGAKPSESTAKPIRYARRPTPSAVCRPTVIGTISCAGMAPSMEIRRYIWCMVIERRRKDCRPRWPPTGPLLRSQGPVRRRP